MAYIEFDLNNAIAGYPVYTRNGKRVEITSFEGKVMTCDVFDERTDFVMTRFYPKDGKYYFPDGSGHFEELITIPLSELPDYEFEK